jgi:tetratricopeptide (TPR) repeat protein
MEEPDRAVSKEKRRFKRYKADMAFGVDFEGKTYDAVAQDYSVDGLSALVRGEPAIKVGEVIELNIPRLGIKTNGKVVRAMRGEGGILLGLQRVGLLYGQIENFAVADILLGLQRSGKTGQLHLKSGKVQKTVYFLRGDIVFASSNLRQDWLGEMLLREKKITRDQFDQSSDRMKDSGKRHGTIMVEMGILRPKDLFESVTRSVERVIISLFAFRNGEFIFKEGPLPEDGSITLRLSAANLIYRGIRELGDIEAVRSMSPGADQVICFSTDPLDLFTDLKLSTEDRKLFSMVDGKKTYRELVKGAGIDAFDAMRAFSALLSTRVIEVQEGRFARKSEEEKTETEKARRLHVGTPRAAEQEPEVAPGAEDVFRETEKKKPSKEEFMKSIEQMHREHRTLGYYGVLEIDQGASSSDIKKGYYKMARTYHPDKHFGLPVEMKEKLNAIFSYITKAYSTLSNPGRRAEYDRSGGKDPSSEIVTDPAQRAAVKFEEGMVLFKGGKHEQAAQVFGEAGYLDSANPKYHYFGAIALQRGGKHKEAERTLQRAIRIEPFNADYLAEAGHIYISLGFANRARTAFEKAMQLAPMHKKAMEGLSKLPAEG